MAFFAGGGIVREYVKMSCKPSYIAISSNISIYGGQGKRQKAVLGCTTRFCKPGMLREKKNPNVSGPIFCDSTIKH